MEGFAPSKPQKDWLVNTKAFLSLKLAVSCLRASHSLVGDPFSLDRPKEQSRSRGMNL